MPAMSQGGVGKSRTGCQCLQCWGACSAGRHALHGRLASSQLGDRLQTMPLSRHHVADGLALSRPARPRRHAHPRWRPWLAVVDHGGQLLHRQTPTLHSWADLQRWAAAGDAGAVLQGGDWARCSTAAWDAAEDARRLAELAARRVADDSEVPELPLPEWVPDAWDLRARAEGRLRRLAEREAWLRAGVGVRAAASASRGAEWQSDVRCGSTGDPNDPAYREFTHREIWDVITQRGEAADPRDVVVEVEDPHATPDMRELGAAWRPSTLEWLRGQGMLTGSDESDGEGPTLEQVEAW